MAEPPNLPAPNSRERGATPDPEQQIVDARTGDATVQEFRVQAVRLEGPLPPAEMLADYEQVMPGLADRIVKMAELEQAHRHQLERNEFEHPYAVARRGQILGLAAVVLFLSFAALLAIKGHGVAAATVAGFDIVAILVVFITGQAPGERGKADEQPEQLNRSQQHRQQQQRRRNRPRRPPPKKAAPPAQQAGKAVAEG